MFTALRIHCSLLPNDSSTTCGKLLLLYDIFPFSSFCLRKGCWQQLWRDFRSSTPDRNPLESISLFSDSFPGVFASNIHRTAADLFTNFPPLCKELIPGPTTAFTTQLQLLQLSHHAIPAGTLHTFI